MNNQNSQKSVFSRIIDREIPTEILFENDEIIIIPDIAPKAPIHWLGITKKPFTDIHALLSDENNKELLWNLYSNLAKLAEKAGIAENGYKLNTNIGVGGGQEIAHLHVHLLAPDPKEGS